MLSESHPIIRQILRFMALPYCYVKLINWKECKASKYQVMKDLLYIFFKLKYFPDNYSPCRFWEIDRKLWSYYYGSSYHPYQRRKLRKEVQRFEYLIIFDDKEVCDLLCRGINVKMPEYFGTISPEMDYKGRIKEVFNSIEDKRIIIKPVLGQAGKGIVLAFQQGYCVIVKDGSLEIKLDDFVLKEKSIIQEVIVQEDTINNISPTSVNTIRIVTLFTRSNEVIIISASMRFAVGHSYVDNWSAGGIAIGVNYKTGKLKSTAYDKNGRRYTEHPDSQVRFDGFLIPKWDEVIKMSKDIQRACPFFKLLGMDIAVTNNGPVLIEVNPNPDIIFQEQTAGPLLQDRKTLEEFKKYSLLINKFQKKL